MFSIRLPAALHTRVEHTLAELKVRHDRGLFPAAAYEPYVHGEIEVVILSVSHTELAPPSDVPPLRFALDTSGEGGE